MGRKKNPYKRADRFTVKAKEEGYAARSVYKLVDIQRRFTILRSGDRVLDLGCAPGSWLGFARKQVGRNGQVVGIDFLPMAQTVPGAVIFEKSIHDTTNEEFLEALGGPADVVMSDMAPRTTGNVLGDHVEQIELADVALQRAIELLRPGGHFVVKVFDGEDSPAFVTRVKKHFGKLKRVRPEAVRSNSREFFVVAMGLRVADE